jgi:hypothetical protein
MTEYRLIHFVPDPFLGGRVPVAAVVQGADGLRVMEAPRLPGVMCLGRKSAVVTIRHVLEDLTRVESFDRLPGSVGPQVVLGDAHSIPPGTDDPVAWLTRLLAGTRDDGLANPHRTREPHLVTRGTQFLRARSVASFVRRKFKPPAGFVRGHSRALSPISQYVKGQEELLLMEPLVPTRRGWHEDMRKVSERVASYKFAMENGGRLPEKPQFFVYVLVGGPDDRRREISDSLTGVADEIVDVKDETAAQRFVAQIRRVAGTATPTLAV